jgi:arylsulfatase A
MRFNFHPAPITKKSLVFIFSVVITAVYFFVGCKKLDVTKPANSIANSASSNDIVVTRPNVVFIVGDDIGYEIPTVNGGQSYSTPNIDLLANNGIRFNQCYGSADCSPARFMLLTGKYNFRNYTEWGVMDRSQHTIGNMLKNAGYATCYVGKWQLDGGDASIRTFGFDKYNVWLPYKRVPEEADGSRYKSPLLYQNGSYLPSSQTQNKYSIDIFTNYALKFIDSNKQKPFFLYYSIPLAHKKFTPTPDDPEYATWDFSNSSKKFFPGMIKYMDKQLKILNDKIQSLGLQNNTVFIFVGDNGSPKGISSRFNGITVPGEKGQTTTYGTHVPLIVSWPGHIGPSSKTNQLVDFTDFMPTLADIAGIPAPQNFGILDGKSFYPVLMGSASSSRDNIYNHFQPFISGNHSRLIKYVQNSTYKLYDDGRFYNIAKDVEETSPIPDSKLSLLEVIIKNTFKLVGTLLGDI